MQQLTIAPTCTTELRCAPAMPMTSRNVRPSGMAAIWMGEGFLYPARSIDFTSEVGRLASSQLRIGSVGLTPL